MAGVVLAFALLAGAALPAAAQTTATLTGLSLTDGVNPVTLSPVFDAATLSYTASVTAGVTHVTVTPTAASGVTTEILDSSDAAIADADNRTAGHQVNVAVGANTIKVKASATGKTAQDYTVTVTRAALPAAPPTGENADGSETVWGANLSVGAYVVTAAPIVNNNSGFSGSILGGLAPVSFTAGGASYSVDRLLRQVQRAGVPAQLVHDKLFFKPLPLFPAADEPRYVLDVGGTAFRLQDVTRLTNVYTWDWSAVTGWSQNAVVPVKLIQLNPPGAPTNLTATPGNAEVALAWTAPVKTGGSAITGYEYCQKLNTTDTCEDADWTAIDDSAPGGANAAGYTVEMLDNGTAYTFQVRAVNAIGGGSESNTATATPATGPATLTGLALTDGVSAVTLSPVFDAATLSYTASVAAGVTHVTVTPTAASGTTTEILDRSDMAIADASTTNDGHQVKVAVGANTIKVRASATGKTAQDYTVTVTRAALPTAPATGQNADGSETVWGAILSVGKVISTPGGVELTTTGFTEVGGGVSSNSFMAGGTNYTVPRLYRQIQKRGSVQDFDRLFFSPSPLFPEDDDSRHVLDLDGTGYNVGDAIRQTNLYAWHAHTLAWAQNDTVPVKLIRLNPPGAPTGLGATAGDTEVTLAWTAPDKNGGSAVTGYQYCQKESTTETCADADWTDIADSAPDEANAAGFTVGSLTNGTAYTFRVRAVNAIGEGLAPHQASATPQVVAAIALKDQEAYQSFTVPGSGGVSPRSFTFDFETGGSGSSDTVTLTLFEGSSAIGESADLVTFKPAAGLNKIVYPAADSPLTGGGIYSIRIKANSASSTAKLRYAGSQDLPTGLSFATARVRARGSSDTWVDTGRQLFRGIALQTAPAAPVLAANPRNGGAFLTWTVPDDGGRAVTKVQYQEKEGTGSFGSWTDIPMSAAGGDNATSFTRTSRTNGTEYTYKVRAVNSKGDGDASNEATVTPSSTAAVPAAPTDLTAEAGEGYVQLRWTPSASDGGSAITRHEYRFKTTGAYTDWSTIFSSSPTGIRGTQYKRYALNGRTYTFQVRAKNDEGESTASNEASAMPTSTDTTAPTVAKAAIHSTRPEEILLTFDEELFFDPNEWTPQFAGLSVSVDGNSATVVKTNQTQTGGVDSGVRITLASAVQPGERVTVSYTPEEHTVDAWPLRDLKGNPVAAFQNMAVENAPGAPQGFTATPGNGVAILAWDAPDGGGTITGHQYRQKTAGSAYGSWKDIPNSARGGANATRYTVSSGVSNGTPYAFQVRAVAGSLNSDPSDAAATTPASATRPANEVWQGTMLPGEGGTSGGCHSSAADPASRCDRAIDDDDFVIGGTTITVIQLNVTTIGQLIFITTPGIPKDTAQRLTLHIGSSSHSLAVESTSQTINTWVITVTGLSLTAGDPVLLRLTESETSAPDAPTALAAAQRGNAQATLTWTAPNKNGGSAITGYQYCQKENATDTCADEDWATIPDSAPGEANAASYTVTGLTNGTTYTFRVRARNALGESAASNAASVTIEEVDTVMFATSTPLSVVEGGSVTVEVVLEAPAAAPVMVPLTAQRGPGLTADEIVSLPTSVTVATGATKAAFTVEFAGDEVDEPDEVLTLWLGTLPQGYVPGMPDRVVLTVLDDDLPEVEVTFAAPRGSVVEGGSAQVTVVLSQAPQRDVVVPVTAQRGAGLEADEVATAFPSSVTFGAQQTRATLTVAFADDTVEESAETLTLGFGALPALVTVGARSQTVLTVEDDDGPPGAVAHLRAGAGDGEVLLWWEAPASKNSNPVRYEVSVDEGAWSAVTDSAGRRHKEGSLDNGTAYAFRVRAVNAKGAGPASAPVTAVPVTGRDVAPHAPTSLRVETTYSRHPELTWLPPSNARGLLPASWEFLSAEVLSQRPRLRGYQVQVCTGRTLEGCRGSDASVWTTVAYTHTTATRYVDRGRDGAGVEKVRSRVYRVRAINLHGVAGPWSGPGQLKRATVVDAVDVSITDDDTVDLRFDVRFPDGNPLYILLHRRGSPNVERRVVRVPLRHQRQYYHAFTGLTPETWYRVVFDFSPTFDSPRRQEFEERTNAWGVRNSKELPTVAPESALVEVSTDGATWSGTGTLPVFMGERSTYRLRMAANACVAHGFDLESGRNIDFAVAHERRLVEAVSTTRRPLPFGVDPAVVETPLVDEVPLGYVVLRCGGAVPGPAVEVSVRAASIWEYLAGAAGGGARAGALRAESIEASFVHRLYAVPTGEGGADNELREFTGLFYEEATRQAGLTVRVQRERTLAAPEVTLAPGTQELRWDAVPRAGGYEVEWRPGDGAYRAGARQLLSGRSFDLGERTWTAARVRALRGDTEIGPWAEVVRAVASAEVSVSDAWVLESGRGTATSMRFAVRLSGPSADAVTVDWATRDDGTAEAGVDYEASSGTVTFAPGDTERFVEVVVLDDAVDDDGETFTLVLSGPEGATLAAGAAEAVGTILNSEVLEEEAPAVAESDLTAVFVAAPALHDGVHGFTVRLVFSEEVALGFRALRDTALAVTGGTVTEAVRVEQGSNRRWTLTVVPSTREAVTVALSAPADCAAAGAVCTADGEALSAPAEVVVPGPDTPVPVRVSVADASGHEGTDAALAFAVTLSGPAEAAVTVDYATADATAGAPADYAAVSGTLAFAAGETQKTVSVPIVADGAAEAGGETLTLALSNPVGAVLAQAQATGTIHDPGVTASFEAVPEAHDGENAFTLRLAFSEEVVLSYRTLRDAALEVSGGTVEQAIRVTAGSNARWNVHIAPDGDAAVRVTLPATADCGASGAVCTAGGVRLAEAVEATVPGPATVPVTAVLSVEGAVSDGAFPVRVAFSAAVTGLGAADLSAGQVGGEAASVTGLAETQAGRAWTARVASTGEGRMWVRAGSVETVAGGESEPAVLVVDVDAEGNVVAVTRPAAFAAAVTPPGDGTWDGGELLQATLRFSEPVTVDSSGGVPSVGIVVDGTARTAAYRGGSGEAVLRFGWTVPDGETPGEVALTADSLALNGGEIAAGGRAADRAHPGAEHTLAPAGPDDELLTASFSEAPDAHDGENAFTLRLAFSEEVELSYLALQGGAVEVAGGTVEQASRVEQGSNRRWTLRIAPDGEDAVTVTLPATADCASSGAVCTDGGKALSAAATATVPGPAPAIAPITQALTARFEGVPREHDGESALTFRVRFSEAPVVSFRTLRDESFAVTGGDATKAWRVDGRNDLRAIEIEPSGLGDVTVTLAGGRACGTTGAICTAGGKVLSNTLTATIEGPAALSVADARAHENADATIDFAVRLDRAAYGTVTVDYATADGTATAGEDYTAASGTLSFAAGETEKTVAVALLDDAKDEGEETFTLNLSNASGAYIADGQATGTIVNSDPLQKAWLARFGRTVAGQVVDAIGTRLEGGAAESHVTVGGQRLALDGAEADGDALAEAEAEAGLEALADFFRGEDGDGDASPTEPRGMTGRELALGSSFHLSAGGGEDGGPAFAAWGRFAQGGFDAEVDGVTLSGEVTTGVLGADISGERWLGGVAVSRSTGEGPFTLTGDGASTRSSGTVESTLTALYPYGRLALNERVDVWGVAGRGSGELTVTEDGGDPISADIAMTMGALGLRGEVLRASQGAPLDLAVKSDALWVRTTSETVTNLVGVTADVTRLRLLLDGSRAFEVGDGGTLTPSLEVGVRHDAGDAETGSGLELGAGVRYQAEGVSVDATVRTLVAHEDGGYEEWGASLGVRIDPDASGRGLSLSVAPTWGNASSQAERLWGLRDARALAPEDAAFEPGHRLDAELGYGFSVLGDRAVATPYAGMSRSETSETLRLGQRLKLGPSEWSLESAFGDEGRTLSAGYGYRVGGALSLSLEASRREPANDNADPEHGIGLRVTARW